MIMIVHRCPARHAIVGRAIVGSPWVLLQVRQIETGGQYVAGGGLWAYSYQFQPTLATVKQRLSESAPPGVAVVWRR